MEWNYKFAVIYVTKLSINSKFCFAHLLQFMSGIWCAICGPCIKGLAYSERATGGLTVRGNQWGIGKDFFSKTFEKGNFVHKILISLGIFFLKGMKIPLN